jgi:hypothetical protein
MDINNDMNNDMNNDILPQVPILRKKWSKPEKIDFPIIENDIENNIVNDIENITKIKKISIWRLRTHKFISIIYKKRSKKILDIANTKY